MPENPDVADDLVQAGQELALEPDALASSTARTFDPRLMPNLGIGIHCSVPSFSLSRSEW